MQVELVHGGFRANFRIVGQREVQLIKVDNWLGSLFFPVLQGIEPEYLTLFSAWYVYTTSREMILMNWYKSTVCLFVVQNPKNNKKIYINFHYIKNNIYIYFSHRNAIC